MNAKAVLTTLENTNGYVTLAIEVAGELIPLGKAVVRGIRQLATGGTTVDYEVLLRMDGAELDAIDKLSTDDLAAINAELAKLGLPPVPPLPPAPQS